jgi:hypothetical protein
VYSHFIRRYACLMPFVAAAALVAPAAAAEHQRIPLSESLAVSYVDDCTGEVVSGTIAGTGHIDIVTGADGRTLFSDHEIFRGKLVGATTGTVYVSNAQIESTSVSGGGGASSSTLVNSSHLLARGTADNIDLTFVEHVTVDANGNVTSDVVVDHFACRG